MGSGNQSSGSLIQARHTANFFAYFVWVAVALLIAALLWYLLLKLKQYKKSSSYTEKQKTRQATRKDAALYARTNKLSAPEESLLWEVCRLLQLKNVNFIFDCQETVSAVFKQAWQKFTEQKASEEKINELFDLMYKIEVITARFKIIKSTKYIPPETVITIITGSNRFINAQLIRNTKDFFVLKFPEEFEDSAVCPKPLERLRFTFKSKNGFNYNFVSRIIRFDTNNPDEKLIYTAHTDQLISNVSRKFKREYINEECIFSPVVVDFKAKDEKFRYKFSNKNYRGLVANISCGGCCIHTSLPVKEKQYLCIILHKLGIDERIVGVIKSTRKLSDGQYALHIKFEKISPRAKNLLSMKINHFE